MRHISEAYAEFMNYIQDHDVDASLGSLYPPRSCADRPDRNSNDGRIIGVKYAEAFK